MQRLIRILKGLVVGTSHRGPYSEPNRESGYAIRSDQAGSHRPVPALPMSRSGIYGSYSFCPEPDQQVELAERSERQAVEIL